MRFALVDGQKIEATKGAKGFCPSCGSELRPRCGEVRVNHWAHKGTSSCDPWWENETEWHRSWKSHFPIDWQEVIHQGGTGEKHIADVKTKNGWVIEFQHSYLDPEERRAREAFYNKLVWVVDGLRRTRDKLQFQRVIDSSRVMMKDPLIMHARFPEECRLLKEWLGGKAPVFFDFQESIEADRAVLWLASPVGSGSDVYFLRFDRSEFVDYHHDERFNQIVLPLRDSLANARTNNSSNRLSGFQQYMQEAKSRYNLSYRRQRSRRF
jgi:competence protein CoiA